MMQETPTPVITTGAVLTAAVLGAIAVGVWAVAGYCKTIAEQTGTIMRCQQDIRRHWQAFNDRHGIPTQEIRDPAHA